MAKILIVDDVPLDLAAVRERLQDEVFEIDTAGSEASALALISEKDFDVILVDLVLDEGNPIGGFDVMNAALDKDPLTQIIVVTGGCEDKRKDIELGIKAMAMGAFDYIFKEESVRGLPMLRAKVKKALQLREVQLRDEHQNRSLNE